MTFSNAYKGIKKLFVAGILSLAGSVCVCLSVVPGILGVSAAFKGSIGGFFAGGIVALLLLLAGLLLPLIAYILKVVGLAQARKDEPRFHMGFLFAVLALIFMLVEVLFTALNLGGSVVDGIVETACGILDVAAALYVIYGIRNIAEKLEEYKLVRDGSTLVKFITIFYAASLFATLIMVLFGSNLIMSLLAGMLSFITAILNLIVYIVLLVYLGRTLKLLKNSKESPCPETMSPPEAAAENT